MTQIVLQVPGQHSQVPPFPELGLGFRVFRVRVCWTLGLGNVEPWECCTVIVLHGSRCFLYSWLGIQIPTMPTVISISRHITFWSIQVTAVHNDVLLTTDVQQWNDRRQWAYCHRGWHFPCNDHVYCRTWTCIPAPQQTFHCNSKYMLHIFQNTQIQLSWQQKLITGFNNAEETTKQKSATQHFIANISAKTTLHWNKMVFY